MAAKSGDVKVADEPDDETGSASGDRHPPHGHRGGVRNQLPFSELGEHMIQRMSEKGMIIDPGHLGVIARDGALDLLEDRRYPGVISSHSWADVDSYPRIHEMGGLVTPYAGDSEGFVEAWDRKKPTLVDGPRAIALPRKTTLECFTPVSSPLLFNPMRRN